MKILLSAYACEPGCGSEEGVGWNTVRHVANDHKVWVLTRIGFRRAIEAELERNPVQNLHFVYFDPFNWTEDWRNKQGLVQLHYYLWQIQAYFLARRLHQEICFDIVRHVTYVKHWSPSFLALLPVPFIWGPVGGAEAAPKAFWKDFSRRGQVYEVLRNLAQSVGECDPFVRLTALRSRVGLATTHETAERLRSLGVKNVQIASQVGLSKEEINTLAQYDLPDGSPVRFISVGRLIHWKGVDLGIRAFAIALNHIPEAEYWIVGDGGERQRLEALAHSLGIGDKIRFWGALPRQETLSKIGQSHVLVHSSLHESGGFVCAEMMAAGRPVICLNLGGPAVQVTEETGIKVAAENPEQTVSDLAKAMIRLAEPQVRIRMGQAGRKRVQEVFDWELKETLLLNLYEKILPQPAVVNSVQNDRK
ncbi:glycosyltransferase family 4 protein [Trichocoleus sp. FACHB-90]|uniref:glycosyltransferase family 4 protein n=1 Tax=Cyanophyceae TaxID=3028117 RepID=UPI001688F5AB|nr:glycosyltransferase family 4 protein [Trichocoleus sp. FACHB-90]MBD1928903.1 glycosyltransferase family 4 protein [Trichocoleus sp. FACHB-90]